MKAGFSTGLSHYDAPPPAHVEDLSVMRDNDAFRFANDLRAWVEFDADGRPAGWGSEGGVVMGATTVRVGKAAMTLAAVKLPDLQPEPLVGEHFVTFTQTCGGRTAYPLPRKTTKAPFVKLQSPWVWSTLTLTIKSDSTSEHNLIGASPFPRHWVYDSHGDLSLKAGVAAWDKWVGQPSWKATPWGDQDSPVLVSAAETALERELSALLMHGAAKPKVSTLREGDVLTRQGESGDSLHLILDGILDCAVDGHSVGVVGPGAIVGERAVLENVPRTATLTAHTAVRVATAPADTVNRAALEQLAAGHHREDRGGSEQAGTPE
jgi:hypothetical protein